MADALNKATRTYNGHSRPLAHRLLLSQPFAIIALLGLTVVLAILLVPNFDKPITVTFLLLDIAPVLLIALPMAAIVLTGEIDLSVASIFGLTSVTLGVLHQAGVPLALAVLAAIVVGAVAGAFNGFLVTVVGLPSLAVTIGTLALYRGLAVGLLGTKAITDFPAEWTALARDSIPGTVIPQIVIPILALSAIFIAVLHFTPFGRAIYATGLNPDAAHFSGVKIRRTKFTLFVLSGAISAFAGVFYTFRFGNSIGSNGVGLELEVVAAVVLGGVSIFGGRGSVIGAIAGVGLIGVLASLLRLANVPANAIDIVTGLVLVVSVVAPTALALARGKVKRSNRRSVASSTPMHHTPTERNNDVDQKV